MMLSSVLSSALHPPPKSLKPFSLNQLPTSKDPIFNIGFASRSPLIGRSRVSGPRNMPELASVDAFGGGDRAERGRLQEAEATLDDGLSGFGRDVSRGGVESVINRMSKWLVAALFALVILWKHDADALWAAMGSVANSWLSITMKQILNHQRPVSALRSDPGMPSSHAQSIFYAAFYALFSLVHWLGMNAFTVTIGTIMLMCGSYLSWLRISQQFHTVSQVLVGAVLGSAFGITWFWLWHTFVLEAFFSSIWVRILVVLGSAMFCTAFLIYVIQHWLLDER